MPNYTISKPYPHQGRWRCRISGGGAKVWAPSQDSPERARRVAEAAVKQAESTSRTIGEAVTEYLAHCTAQGHRDSTLLVTRKRLDVFLRPLLARPLGDLTPHRCATRYAERTSGRSAATHRNELHDVRRLCKWCVERGYLRSDPTAQVKLVGRIPRGKPQLTEDEGGAWLGTALKLATGELLPIWRGKNQDTVGWRQRCRAGALAACMSLMMGLRASEITKRIVRDLDDGGAKLHVSRAKTAAGNRPVPVPALLQPLLRRQCADSLPNALIFPGEDGEHPPSWVRDWVRQICKMAGVPMVCAHAMRGLYATLGVASGIDPDIVARQLGHRSSNITLRHYAAPASQDVARAAAVLKLVK